MPHNTSLFSSFLWWCLGKVSPFHIESWKLVEDLIELSVLSNVNIQPEPGWKQHPWFKNKAESKRNPTARIRIYFNNHSRLIEGLNNAVHTYTGTRFPRSWFPFCMVRYGEKQQNTVLLLIYFIGRFEISTECVFEYSCHSVVIWYSGMN